MKKVEKLYGNVFIVYTSGKEKYSSKVHRHLFACDMQNGNSYDILDYKECGTNLLLTLINEHKVFIDCKTGNVIGQEYAEVEKDKNGDFVAVSLDGRMHTLDSNTAQTKEDQNLIM